MRALFTGLALLLAAGLPAAAQGSQHALRFHGTGTAGQDRALVQLDDMVAGPDASAPCDVGADGFTLELWVRGTHADNPSPGNGAGGVLTPDATWRNGNVVLDRHTGGTARRFGVSIAGGHVRFGVGRGDTGTNSESTLEGQLDVLDGYWHHVACMRDRASGVMAIFVDGKLDTLSPPGTSTADVSYPDGGPLNPQPALSPYLAIGAEKFDTGPAYPSFKGYVDELRIWDVALTPQQLALHWYRVVPPDTPGLVAAYRFEEGSGQQILDSSAAGSPVGLLFTGNPGNGEWTDGSLDPLAVAPVLSGALPPGFQRTLIADTLSDPTCLAIAADGRIFVGKHDGKLLLVQNGQVLPPLIQLPATVSWGSRGLLGMALDPAFALNGWIYVFYTTLEPRNRVSRFTVAGNSINPASEHVVWQHASLATEDHHGGGLAFGGDGRLYIATGDAADSSLAQQLGSESGKILRVNPDGTIPPNNPWSGVPGTPPALYASGLRNPFRMSYDSVRDRLWVGDVGGNSAQAWEELNAIVGGANYGWPDQEGLSCYISSCIAFARPVWTYRHNEPQLYWQYPQGSITLGTTYLSDVFPAEYRGNLFVGDYANRWIRRLVFDNAGLIVDAPMFMQLAQSGSIVDMAVGPDGALYYVTYAAPGGHSFADVGALYRISYTGSTNVPPVAVASAQPQQGSAPLQVSFDGGFSLDPDAGPQPLSYSWDFGDGGSSTSIAPTHTYLAPGTYEVRLTVSDGQASAVSEPIEITAGNPPVVTMVRPLVGLTYKAGDIVDCFGFATDIEDGPIPPQGLEWTITLLHTSHAHPFLGPIQGNATSFQVPLTGHPPEDTRYRVTLKATDSHGQIDQEVREIHPQVSTLLIDTWPSGIPVFLDGQAEATPRTYASLVGYQLAVEAQRSFVLGGKLWLFRYWSDGGARAHVYNTPPGGDALRAVYSPAVTLVSTTSVPALERNAGWSPGRGQEHSAPNSPGTLTLGKKSGQPMELGLEFLPQVPQGALILSAKLEVTASGDQSGGMVTRLRGYKVDDAPAFQAGSLVALSAWAPLSSAQIGWNVPLFQAGGVYASSDLTLIVQELVDQPGWAPGKHMGLVLDVPGPVSAWRSVANFTSGQPPRLVITYAVPQVFSPGPPALR